MAPTSAWVCVVLLAMVACFGAGANAGRSLLQSTTCPDPTLPDVNLTAYQGVWYQIGSTAMQKAMAETYLVCTSGRYSLVTSGADANGMRVRLDSYNVSSGAAGVLIGLATVHNRSLSLAFPGLPAASDYRILYLGGNASDQYKTSLVYSCTPGSFQALSILSRKPTLDDDESIQGLVQKASALGITLEANNQMVQTVQDPITCGRNDD